MRDAHIRFSNDGNIEKIIAILREILDNNNIGYDRDKIECTRKNLQNERMATYTISFLNGR